MGFINVEFNQSLLKHLSSNKNTRAPGGLPGGLFFEKSSSNNFQLFALLGFSRSKVEASGHLDVDGGAFSAPLRSWILGFGLWSMGAQCDRIPSSRGSLWVEVLTVGWLVGKVGKVGWWVTWGPCDVKNKDNPQQL